LTLKIIRFFKIKIIFNQMKMTIWLTTLILSSIITLLAILIENNDKYKNKIQYQNTFTYGIKIFIISYLVIYVGLLFMNPESDIKHEIEIGEAPF